MFMKTHLQITPRILIVEDNLAQSRAMELSLSSASRDLAGFFGILPFQIEKAISVNGAKKCLDEASNIDHPYDICMLDLSLPRNDKGSMEDPRGGYEVIEHIAKTQAAKRVIVVSVFSEYQYVIE